LIQLKNAAGLPPKIKASFDESYVQVEQNLLWYKYYHTTVNQWTGAPMEPMTTESDTTVTSDVPVTSDAPVTPDTPVTSNTTEKSPDTTVSSNGTTGPMQPMSTYPQFDFDNPTLGPVIISKCPNKSGQSSCRSSLFFVIIVVTMVTNRMFLYI